MTLITINDLTLSYDKNVIVHDLSFKVDEGDYLCIAGENGSGKTSLIKAMLGLTNIASGSIEFGEGLCRTDIGYLPQQTAIQQDFPATCKEVVLSGFASGLGIRPFYSAAERKDAYANMERMGVEEFARKSFRDLSGGQKQRILLARALCAAKKIMVLDEPASGLDPGATAEMYALIGAINEGGMSIVMITHDTESMIHYASHVLELGKDRFYGTKREYLDRANREEDS